MQLVYFSSSEPAPKTLKTVLCTLKNIRVSRLLLPSPFGEGSGERLFGVVFQAALSPFRPLKYNGESR